MKETFYFSHDYNAQSDEKILELRMDLGWKGYGIYWSLIERLASNNGILLLNNIKSIAFDMNIDKSVISQILHNYNLFIINEEKGIFYNNRLLEHLEKRNIIQQKKSEAGKKGMAKRWGNKKKNITDDIQKDNTTYNTPITKGEKTITNYNKGKERKVKESKVKETNIYKPTKINIFEEHSFEYKASDFFLLYHTKKQTPSILYLLKTKGVDNILQKWSKTIYDLQNLDNFSQELIGKVIKFTLKDDFWKDQILSIEKFRKKKDGVSYFIRMVDKIKQEENKNFKINPNLGKL